MSAPVLAAAEIVLEGADEETWLDARQPTYGGSEISAILGVSQYSTPVREYLLRTGQVKREKREKAEQSYGKRFESVVRDWYAEDSGLEVYAPPTYTLYRSREFPLATCTPDGFVGAEVVPDGAYEGKTQHWVRSDEWDAESGRSPIAYEAQCIWNSGVLGLDFTDLVALFGYSLVHIRVPADPLVFADLLAAVERFEGMVQRREMPDPDASEVTKKALTHQAGEVVGKAVLPESFLADQRRRARLKETAKRIEERVTEIDNRILVAMGDAKEAWVGDVKLASLAEIPGGHRSFDTEPFRRLFVNKPPKEKRQ